MRSSEGADRGGAEPECCRPVVAGKDDSGSEILSGDRLPLRAEGLDAAQPACTRFQDNKGEFTKMK